MSRGVARPTAKPGQLRRTVAAIVAIALLVNIVASFAAGAQDSQIRRSGAPDLAPPTHVEKHPKLDSRLLAIANRARDGGIAQGLRAVQEQSLVASGERVRVLIQSNAPRATVRAALASRDAIVESEYADLLQAYVPLGALRAIADLPIVESVRAPATPVPDA